MSYSIRSKETILNCSEAAVQSHPFSKIPKENAFKKGSFFRKKLQTDSPEHPFYTKVTPPRMFSWKSSEFFYSN